MIAAKGQYWLRCLLLALAFVTWVGCDTPALNFLVTPFQANQPVRPLLARQADLQTVDPADFPNAQQDVQNIFNRYVDDQGYVDYPALADDPNALRKLDRFLIFLAKLSAPICDQPGDSLTRRIAYYLNAHNVASLHALMTVYPIKQLRDCRTDFDNQVLFEIDCQWLSLSQIAQRCFLSDAEKQNWRLDDDPRLAFAISRPTLSGPRPLKTLFTPENLDQQLNHAIAAYLGNCSGLQIDHAHKRVLFGPLVLEKQAFFINRYKESLKPPYVPKNVSLVSAIIPWTEKRVEKYLVNAVGYDIAELKPCDQLNDLAVKNKKEPLYNCDKFKDENRLQKPQYFCDWK